MKYTVQIQRIVTQITEIEIEANSEYEARTKAKAQRETVEYSTTDTEYDFPEVI